MIQAETHDRRQQHLLALAVQGLAAGEVRQMAEAAGPEVDVVEQISQRDRRQPSLQSSLELLSSPGTSRSSGERCSSS